MNGWLALAVVALLAGCAQPKETRDNPYVDDSFAAGTPWTSWDGPIASQSDGCSGPCVGPASTGPEFRWAGVDHEGRVLLVEWSLGPPGIRMMDPRLEPWNATVAAIFAPDDEYGQEYEDDGVRVFAVHAWRLDGDDLPDVDRRLDDAMARLQPLGPPDYGAGCADCAASVLKAKGMRVELWGNAPDGSGWPDLERELLALSDWAARQDAGQGS
jgi:hypothetical protein